MTTFIIRNSTKKTAAQEIKALSLDAAKAAALQSYGQGSAIVISNKGRRTLSVCYADSDKWYDNKLVR